VASFISQERLKLELSHFEHGENIASLAEGTTNHVTHFCMLTVTLEKFAMARWISEVNSAVDGGPLLLGPSTVDTTKAQAPSVRFIVYLLQTCF